MGDRPAIETFGALKEAGHRQRSVRQELRDNLVARLRAGEPLFSGIHGYQDSVVPALENALLSGHDMLLLGERGQAKTRLIRGLVTLLDEWLPTVEGSEVRDDPFAPVSAYARGLLAERGDDTPVAWVHRDARYGEKLATPDVSTADLIGDVDPVKVARGRTLSDEETMHFGLLPRSNRGLFCINELPDLTEKVQVALFNVMQERDVQVKGYAVRLPLDLMIFASANPEDYTSRGRIITPLKDRYAAQIRTHYPRDREVELAIVAQEARVPEVEGVRIVVPELMRRLIAEITFQARSSPDVNQASGVSVRMSIANYETLLSSAVRRALYTASGQATPRIADLSALLSGIQGKLELEYAASDRSEGEIVDDLVRRAVRTVFDERFGDVTTLQPVYEAFKKGWMVEVSTLTPPAEFLDGLDQIPALRDAARKLVEGDSPEELASAVEFILEGLHLHNKLNKTVRDEAAGGAGRYAYGGQ